MVKGGNIRWLPNVNLGYDGVLQAPYWPRLTDFNAIRREVQVYKKVAPSAIQIYKDQLEMCNVYTIHSLPVQVILRQSTIHS